MRISDWSSDVCSSELDNLGEAGPGDRAAARSLMDAESRDDTDPRHVGRRSAACLFLGTQRAQRFAHRLGRDRSRAAHRDPGLFERARAAARRSRVLRRQRGDALVGGRSEEHTSELQSLMRISYAVFCLTNKKNKTNV